jgi:hypothetical protein
VLTALQYLHHAGSIFGAAFLGGIQHGLRDRRDPPHNRTLVTRDHGTLARRDEMCGAVFAAANSATLRAWDYFDHEASFD